MDGPGLTGYENSHGGDPEQSPHDKNGAPRWGDRGVISITRRQEADEACMGVSRTDTSTLSQGLQKYMVAPYGHPSVELNMAAPANQNVKKTLHAMVS